jgi:hypothetical protein
MPSSSLGPYHLDKLERDGNAAARDTIGVSYSLNVLTETRIGPGICGVGAQR